MSDSKETTAREWLEEIPYPQGYIDLLIRELCVKSLDDIQLFGGNEDIEEIWSVEDLGLEAKQEKDLSEESDNQKELSIGCVLLWKTNEDLIFISEQNASPIAIYLKKTDWDAFQKRLKIVPYNER